MSGKCKVCDGVGGNGGDDVCWECGGDGSELISTDWLCYRHRGTNKGYATGGRYGDAVMVLLDFGWIVSTKYNRRDLEKTNLFYKV